jgi:hypothetical protein
LQATANSRFLVQEDLDPIKDLKTFKQVKEHTYVIKLLFLVFEKKKFKVEI